MRRRLIHIRRKLRLKSICELPRLKFMFRNGIHNSCWGAFDLVVENTFVHNLNPPHYHCNCGLPNKTEFKEYRNIEIEKHASQRLFNRYPADNLTPESSAEAYLISLADDYTCVISDTPFNQTQDRRCSDRKQIILCCCCKSLLTSSTKSTWKWPLSNLFIFNLKTSKQVDLRHPV